MANQKVLNFNKEEKEVWKDIEGYEGYYQVSNFGRIKSLKRVIKGYKGEKKTLKEKIRKQPLNPYGYPTIGFSKNGVAENFKTHRVVAEAFIPNPDNKPQINHRDGDKENNHVDNLEWCTQLENMRHAHNNGLIPITPGPKGEDCNLSKLTEGEVLKIREMYRKTKLNQRQIAELFGVGKDNVSKIVNRVSWRHI